MSTFGITMVKDEEEIIGWTLPRMAKQLDHVIVADNMSTDDTYDILCETAKDLGNISVINDDNPAYFQSRKMTELAQFAGELGADWVVPFDADEVWESPHGPLSAGPFPAEHHIIAAAIHDHVVTGADEIGDPDPITRIRYRRTNALTIPKVAVRFAPGLVIEQGNHNAHYPGRVTTCDTGWLVHHYPYRSVEQMVAKVRNGAAAYAAAGEAIPYTVGQHWREYGHLLQINGESAIEEIFTTWFYVQNPDEAEDLACSCIPPSLP